MNYASFGRRIIAFILDSLILGFALSIFGDNALLQGILGLLYYSLFEASTYQATLGKMAMGLQVTDLYGSPVTVVSAALRHLSKILSGLIFGIGYLFPLFTEKKQALHDLIANCLVVEKR